MKTIASRRITSFGRASLLTPGRKSSRAARLLPAPHATSLFKVRKDVQLLPRLPRSPQREARRIFGRDLSEREAGLIAAFREGLDPGNRRGVLAALRGIALESGCHGIFPAPSPCTI